MHLALACGVVVIMGLAAAWGLGRSGTRVEAPGALDERHQSLRAKAQALLLRDDLVSIEEACALFGELTHEQPERPDLIAELALATTLHAEALAAEADDWKHVLDASEDLFEDARTRRDVLLPRAKHRLEQGTRLAIDAWSQPGMSRRPLAVSALMLAFANDGAFERVAELEAALGEEERRDAWVRYAGARAGTTRTESEQPSFGALPRSLWQKGREALWASPPSPNEARAAFEAVLRENARHEGARRGLALLEALFP